MPIRSPSGLKCSRLPVLLRGHCEPYSQLVALLLFSNLFLAVRDCPYNWAHSSSQLQLAQAVHGTPTSQIRREGARGAKRPLEAPRSKQGAYLTHNPTQLWTETPAER
ncbi:hypothetical protein BD410DRAFT_841875 [Rickenella mellea]|uniref:Uncharacterized protein n=1 Tax=Rickenella mellea TaxID=50990 RepID=A0A4Y7PTU1_9AGAM|nr:hypothetical protein BD410DRAFT_842792 [Rickenella mellea]TDL18477.1 hypothetical protein BD410DRAFT_842801 [Rickenella mellea]TDL19717.1 hypothetical protein BD410DRAFT_841875 [Rickenella mellea]